MGRFHLPALIVAGLSAAVLVIYVTTNPSWTWWAVGHLVALVILAGAAAVVPAASVRLALLAAVAAAALFLGAVTLSWLGLALILIAGLSGWAVLREAGAFTRADLIGIGGGAVLGVVASAVVFALASRPR